ncbi:MAG: hypothetical protein JOY99_16455 [Sphingomonadaceae bacterium]|nr:hypothetical protein [Sphingomonadaceae bacterium]
MGNSKREPKPPRLRRQGEDPSPEDGADRGDGRTNFGTFADNESGNPKGRPKGSLNASTLAKKVLFQLMQFPSKDGMKTMSRLEANIEQLSLLGLKKLNVPALIRTIELGLALEAKEAAQVPNVPLAPADLAMLELLRKRLAEREADEAKRGQENEESSDGGE